MVPKSVPTPATLALKCRVQYTQAPGSLAAGTCRERNARSKGAPRRVHPRPGLAAPVGTVSTRPQVKRLTRAWLLASPCSPTIHSYWILAAALGVLGYIWGRGHGQGWAAGSWGLGVFTFGAFTEPWPHVDSIWRHQASVGSEFKSAFLRSAGSAEVVP